VENDLSNMIAVFLLAVNAIAVAADERNCIPLNGRTRASATFLMLLLIALILF